eukprot:TRINITY_DN2885_c0_g1_i14.p1 TRINITY_DN2885_c0_g1~~TRINITY_DN2885_c0_g1_i14.p1  ORF type:complete len:348 (+),score=2.64 TRINITY_DN2885_c0_g1_i14:50-1093(+)
MSLAEFVVLQKLGQGSYGVVYQAKRISDGQFYVLKKIDLARMSAKEQQDAVQEVKILASVDHPSIVKYYDSFLDRTHLCIVMELAKKGTIADRLKSLGSRKLQETVIWKWFLQICLGLKHLHDKRILHRDIKSTNVFLDSEENIKIGDLGLARVLDYSSQLASTMVGTPYYLSPELCENRPYNGNSGIHLTTIEYFFGECGLLSTSLFCFANKTLSIPPPPTHTLYTHLSLHIKLFLYSAFFFFFFFLLLHIMCLSIFICLHLFLFFLGGGGGAVRRGVFIKIRLCCQCIFESMIPLYMIQLQPRFSALDESILVIDLCEANVIQPENHSIYQIWMWSTPHQSCIFN